MLLLWRDIFLVVVLLALIYSMRPSAEGASAPDLLGDCVICSTPAAR